MPLCANHVHTQSFCQMAWCMPYLYPYLYNGLPSQASGQDSRLQVELPSQLEVNKVHVNEETPSGVYSLFCTSWTDLWTCCQKFGMPRQRDLAHVVERSATGNHWRGRRITLCCFSPAITKEIGQLKNWRDMHMNTHANTHSHTHSHTHIHSNTHVCTHPGTNTGLHTGTPIHPPSPPPTHTQT